MDQKIVYSKTGKGVLEIKSSARKLSRELAKVLSRVDGKSAVADLAAKSKLSEANLARCLKQLEEAGYIKEFAGLSSGLRSSASSASASAYVDDLDFTAALPAGRYSAAPPPAKNVYSNAQTEFRASESADRKRAEAEATRNRKAGEERKKLETKRQAREEVARMARVEAERKAKQAAAIKSREQSKFNEKRLAAEMAKTTRDLAQILEVERRALDKSDSERTEQRARRSSKDAGGKRPELDLGKRPESALGKRPEPGPAKPPELDLAAPADADPAKRPNVDFRKREEEILRRYKEELGRKRGKADDGNGEDQDRSSSAEEERRKREEEERRKREEEERQKREEEERQKREEEERQKREEEERQKREEEERQKREEEERRKREEEERRKREEEERQKREEEERRIREEEERRKREEEERRKREEEERRREEEERRREEENRRRDEENRRREKEDRRKREEEERRKREEEELQTREEDERRKREEAKRRKRELEERLRRELAERGRKDEERLREKEKSAAPTFDINAFEDPDNPSAPEAKESAPEDSNFPSLTADSSDSFSIDFDKQQESLAKQAAVEDRRIREMEETRQAMERAAREEDARAEAERRAAIEAEMRARVEQEKADRGERENEKREEYKRKIQEAEDRKKITAERKEQEEQERIDTERKQREDELAHRREAAEEAARKRRELKSLKRSGKVRSPVDRFIGIVGGVLVVLALAIGVLHVMPMSGYIPALEKMASNNIGEPVTIGSMKLSMLSGLQFKLTNVNIGSTQDVILNEVTVTPELGSVLGDRLVIKSVEANGGKIVKEALLRLPLWRDSSARDPRMHVKSIALRGLVPELHTFQLPSLNVDIVLGRDGQVISARVETTNGKVYATIIPGDNQANVTIGASDWTLPFGTPIQISDFVATGSVTGSVLNLSEWDASLYGGQVKGAAQISWASGWRASSQFEFVRVVTDELLAVFTKTAKVTGAASGKVGFSASSGSLHTLLDRPSLQASFLVQKGTLDGVDLVRALQVGSAGSQGGSTKFQELSGNVTISNRRFSYRNVYLSAGILSAKGNFDISSRQAVSGRVTVALRSSVQRLTSSLNVTGMLTGVLLRP
jgi:hypothetical protein